jgi:hypothetical protein
MRNAIFPVILGVPISFHFVYNPAEIAEARAFVETGHKWAKWDIDFQKKGLIKGSNVPYSRQSGESCKGLRVVFGIELFFAISSTSDLEKSKVIL